MENKMPIKSLDHVNFLTHDKAATIKFYCEIIGLVDLCDTLKVLDSDKREKIEDINWWGHKTTSVLVHMFGGIFSYVGFEWVLDIDRLNFNLRSKEVNLPTVEYSDEPGGFHKASISYNINPFTALFVGLNYLFVNLGKLVGWLIGCVIAVPAYCFFNARYWLKEKFVKRKFNQQLRDISNDELINGELDSNLLSSPVDVKYDFIENILAPRVTTLELLTCALQKRKGARGHQPFLDVIHFINARALILDRSENDLHALAELECINKIREQYELRDHSEDDPGLSTRQNFYQIGMGFTGKESFGNLRWDYALFFLSRVENDSPKYSIAMTTCAMILRTKNREDQAGIYEQRANPSSTLVSTSSQELHEPLVVRDYKHGNNRTRSSQTYQLLPSDMRADSSTDRIVSAPTAPAEAKRSSNNLKNESKESSAESNFSSTGLNSSNNFQI